MADAENPDLNLLPCPFCGGAPQLVTTSRRYDFCAAVECVSCGVNTGPPNWGWADDDGGIQAAAKWNRRADPELKNSDATSREALDPDKLDDAVLAMLSVFIIDSEIGNRPGIQTVEGYDDEALVRLHRKGYLATYPHQPINAIWLTPEGARRARELFRQMFCG